jgi:hypothetical protein
MGPRLSAAASELATHAGAALSRWTHRVGVIEVAPEDDTPT